MRLDPAIIEGYIEVDENHIVDLVALNYSPERVFPEKELREWAEDNGYVKEESDGTNIQRDMDSSRDLDEYRSDMGGEALPA